MKDFGAMTPRRARQLWYAPVLALATAFMMARLLALAKLVDMDVFGELGFAFLVSSTFSMLGCLGLQALLQRDMPVLFLRGREAAARVLLMQCVIVAYGSVTVVLLAAASLQLRAGFTFGLTGLALLHGLSQQLFVLASLESRSRSQPLRFAMHSLVRALAIVAVGLGAAVLFDSAEAVVAAEALASLLIAHWLLRRTLTAGELRACGLLQLALRRWRLVDWRAAIVLLLVALLGLALASIDRWAAASLLDLQAFASYTFAGMVLAIAVSLQAMINAAVYPMMARLHASSGQAACFALSRRLSLTLLAASLLLVWPAYRLLGEGVRSWFPAYGAAIALLPTFLIAASFRLSDFWSSYLIITGRQGRLLKINLAAGAAGTLAWALLMQPWQAPRQLPEHFAALALALCLSGYIAVASASWHGARPEVS